MVDRHAPQILEVQQQFEAGGDDTWRADIQLQPPPALREHLTCCERWEYPSLDLERYRDRRYPYERTREAIPHGRVREGEWASPANPWNWDMVLLVRLVAEGHTLVVPLLPGSCPGRRPGNVWPTCDA
jgi:hypothetical protein